MERRQPSRSDLSAEVARRVVESLQRERIIPRFVDSYVVEHGRQALQVHASRYRDLLHFLEREALLAMSARALEIASAEPPSIGRTKQRPALRRDAAGFSRKDAAAFRRKYLAALTRQQNWSAGDALEFQSDLQLYEDLLAKKTPSARFRKPFEAANHPFVDRSAFMLDSSFLEEARVAASKALNDLEVLAARVVASVLEGNDPASLSRDRKRL